MSVLFYKKGRVTYPSTKLPSSKSAAHFQGVYSTVRNPSDPLFYAPVTLQNIVVGSRYWIAQASDLSNVLATGVAGTTTVTTASLPSLENPMLIEVRVRNASGEPDYEALTTYGYLGKDGVTIFISQKVDSIAN